MPPILHARIPLSAHIPMLQTTAYDIYPPQQALHLKNSPDSSSESQYLPHVHQQPMYEMPQEQPAYYMLSRSPPEPTGPAIHGRHTFPTPSELLSDMSSSIDNLSISSSSSACDSSWSTNTPSNKARRRVVAESIGFDSTDPDTITPHDKKRNYLECLESYVTYLNSYFESLGIPVPPLSRADHQKDLGNRSMRTLLVHMSHKTEELNLSRQREEKRWLQLKEEVARREAQFSSD
ncbi:hypothetical protein CVT24_003286 [Panaeolus cyanescens]|uniref:Uncharacterized protein n=1 Tax=Panaeolus cyanescens TaxID=181874 RepID=A0A409YRA5_9AGAR|nr:hypothetical protein CVT24_003286 [Panaeolus cyanescens]